MILMMLFPEMIVGWQTLYQELCSKHRLTAVFLRSSSNSTATSSAGVLMHITSFSDHEVFVSSDFCSFCMGLDKTSPVMSLHNSVA